MKGISTSKNNLWSKLLTVLLFSSAVFNTHAQNAQKKQPNILFILADDLGRNDLGCYGNAFNETKNIDGLAKNGLLFSQAYSASTVCSPTRASILTGKHPARLQLTNFIIGDRTDEKSPVLPAKWKPYLENEEVTIPELLKQKGYATGMVGKWHLGDKENQAPWSQGFDYSRLIGKNGLDYYNYSIFIDSYKKEFTDSGKEYLTDKLTDYGVEFIQQNSGKPFFLYMAYSAPHVFLVPRADKLRKYFIKYQKFERKYNPNYAAVIESLDDGVGRLISTLKEQGLLENTIVIFTSDNGALGLDELGPAPTVNDPLRKWKGHIYEGGTSIPAIVSWPGRISPGIKSNRYFSTIDYLPTLSAAVGIKQLPGNIDGSSILQEWFAPDNGKPQTNPVFWHYPHFSNQLGRPAGSVRVGDFKLVENYENGNLELYNLKTDISESKDLSSVMAGKTQELYKLLVNWRKDVNAQMPILRTKNQ